MSEAPRTGSLDPSLRLVVVIPAFNEATRLAPDEFIRFLAIAPGVGFHFVDDGSTDTTWEIIESLASAHPGRLSGRRRPVNAGKAAAVYAGVRDLIDAGVSIGGYFDADLSTPLDQILPMAAILEARPDVDLVLGSRVRRHGSQVHRSATRHYVSRLFSVLASLVLRHRVHDSQCGAKLFRLSGPMAAAFAEPFRATWAFDVEMIGRYLNAARTAGRDPHEGLTYHPVERWVHVGGSKVLFRHGLIALVELTRIARWTRRTD